MRYFNDSSPDAVLNANTEILFSFDMNGAETIGDTVAGDGIGKREFASIKKWFIYFLPPAVSGPPRARVRSWRSALYSVERKAVSHQPRGGFFTARAVLF